jgi:hypothetical protein
MGGAGGRDDGKSSTIGSEGFENEILFESMSGNAGVEDRCGVGNASKRIFHSLVPIVFRGLTIVLQLTDLLSIKARARHWFPSHITILRKFD